MAALEKSFKLHPLGTLVLKDSKKVKHRHYKLIRRILGVDAKYFDRSLAVVRQFLKHCIELSIVQFDNVLLVRFKNQLKNIRLLRVIKLESDYIVTSQHYKKIFKWCPLIKSLSMRIPYGTVPCLRLTRQVTTLDISIPGKPFDKPRMDYLRNYFSKLLKLQNLVLELPRVILAEIMSFMAKTPRIKTLGLQGLELDLPKKDQKIEVDDLAKIDRIKFQALTMDHIRFLANNTPAFQNLKWLESSKSNQLITFVSKKEDIPPFEKLRYLEAMTVLKLNLRINTMKHEEMLTLIQSISFPIGLEKMAITLAIQNIPKEDGLDESLAAMINKLADSISLASMAIQLKVNGDFPTLKTLFPRLQAGFVNLYSFSFNIMGESKNKIELDKAFTWLSGLPKLDFLVLYVPLKELSGFKDLKFPENGFPKLTRFNVMTMHMDEHNSEASRYFIEYISQIKGITSMHLNSWEQGFEQQDLADLLKYLPNLQNMRELNLSINCKKEDLEMMADLAELMKLIPKLHIFNLFLRAQSLDVENFPDQNMAAKFQPYTNAGKIPKLFVNQVLVN